MHTQLLRYASAIIISVCTVVASAVVLQASCGSNNGIIPHPGGQAVYLQGEACVVNATPDIDQMQFHDLMVWCSTEHMLYLVESQQQ